MLPLLSLVGVLSFVFFVTLSQAADAALGLESPFTAWFEKYQENKFFVKLYKLIHGEQGL